MSDGVFYLVVLVLLVLLSGEPSLLDKIRDGYPTCPVIKENSWTT